jgi:hypothetical protein
VCVARGVGVERCEQGVLVVSIDRLARTLWEVANGTDWGQPMQLDGRSVA